MKKLYYTLIILVLPFLAICQNEFYVTGSGTGVHVQNENADPINNPTLYVDGEVKIESAGALTNTAGEIQVTGDWTNNASFNSTGTERFIGTSTQNVSGNMSSPGNNANSFHHWIIAKPAQTIVNLNTDTDVTTNGQLEFASGGIIQTNTHKVIVKNPNPNPTTGAIIGYETPNATGAYANDKYIHGTLHREIDQAANYVFPIGDAVAGEAYNPVQLNLTNVPTRTNITGKFVPTTPGTFTYSGIHACPNSSGQAWIEYNSMTNEGFWNFQEGLGITLGYDITLHPNLLNLNTNPSSDGNYRALKAPSGTGGSAWPASSATDGDFCVVGSYYAIPGNGYLGFSDFAPGGSSTPLSVELVSLFAKPVDNRFIKVDWETATEKNNAGFELQRSVDGITYKTIQWVEGQGDSDIETYYNYNDEGVKANVLYYYRLNQINTDGEGTLSEVVTAMIRSNDHIITDIMPNPAHSNADVAIYGIKDDFVNLKVYTLLGQLMYNRDIEITQGLNLISLDVSAWPAAMYEVVLEFESDRSVKKLIVTNR